MKAKGKMTKMTKMKAGGVRKPKARTGMVTTGNDPKKPATPKKPTPKKTTTTSKYKGDGSGADWRPAANTWLDENIRNPLNKWLSGQKKVGGTTTGKKVKSSYKKGGTTRGKK